MMMASYEYIQLMIMWSTDYRHATMKALPKLK